MVVRISLLKVLTLPNQATNFSREISMKNKGIGDWSLDHQAFESFEVLKMEVLTHVRENPPPK